MSGILTDQVERIVAVARELDYRLLPTVFRQSLFQILHAEDADVFLTELRRGVLLDLDTTAYEPLSFRVTFIDGSGATRVSDVEASSIEMVRDADYGPGGKVVNIERL